MVQKSLVQPKTRMSSEDRRSQLLRAAIETFALKGFGGTKTKDIAAAAGISEAILFRHFASKEDLYNAILDAKESDESAERAILELQEFVDRRDDLGLFRQFGFQIIRSFRDDPAFQRLMLYARLEGHLLADLFSRRFAHPTGDFMRDYVELRQKEGAFRQSDPKVTVMFAVGTYAYYGTARYLMGVTKRSIDQTVIEEFAAMIVNGVKNTVGKPKSRNVKKRR